MHFSLTYSFYILGHLSIHICMVSYILASEIEISELPLLQNSLPGLIHSLQTLLSHHIQNLIPTFPITFYPSRWHIYVPISNNSSSLKGPVVHWVLSVFITLPCCNFPPTELRFHGPETLVISFKIFLAPLPPFLASFVPGNTNLRKSQASHTMWLCTHS